MGEQEGRRQIGVCNIMSSFMFIFKVLRVFQVTEVFAEIQITIFGKQGENLRADFIFVLKKKKRWPGKLYLILLQELIILTNIYKTLFQPINFILNIQSKTQLYRANANHLFYSQVWSNTFQKRVLDLSLYFLMMTSAIKF